MMSLQFLLQTCVAIVVSFFILVQLFYLILRFPQPDFDEKAVLKIVQDYSKRSHKEDSKNNECSNQPLKGIRIIITGPTSGIGMALAKLLYGLGATIIAIGRSPKRLESLQVELEDSGTLKDEQTSDKNDKRFFAYTADFSDLDAVHSACKKILADFSDTHVDFLINNAGVPNLFAENGDMLRTKQNYELVFGTNYLSHYLITNQLMPLLERSPNFPRVVYVASNFHRGVNGDALLTSEYDANSPKYSHQPVASGLNPNKIPTPMHAYANSKYAQILHMRSINKEQQRKFNNCQPPLPLNRKVQATAVCPGAVRTSIHKGGKGKKDLIASMSFPVNLSTQCIFYAMFSPSSAMTDYFKNVPTLFFIYPPSLISNNEKLRFVFIFFMAVVTMPFQKFMFSKEMYTELSDEGTYDPKRQENLEQWSKEELSRWLH